MTLFDSYLMIDWSAASRPRPPREDSIWIAWGSAGCSGVAAEPRPTRAAALRTVRELLQRQAARGRRVLVGFDFAYAYPRGLARALGLAGHERPWRRVWREVAALVRDAEDNASNRFAAAARLNARIGDPDCPGPFWGCPPSQASDALRLTSPGFPYPAAECLDEYRLADRLLRSRKRQVQSVWKLYGAGSVGSQSLVGIPALLALREDPELAPVSRVWPFETPFSASPSPESGPFVLHAEIWPGILESLDGIPGTCRDEQQVRGLVERFRRLDTRGELGRLFAPELAPEEARVCREEEGWILGA